MGLILVSIVPLTLSGYAVWDEWGGEWLEEVHEFFGNAMLMVVLVHVGLIALLSALRRKNQALPMLTGRVPGPGPDLAKHNHRALAALVLACVLGVLGLAVEQRAGATLRPPAGAGARITTMTTTID